MGCYSRLKHNVMFFTVGILYFRWLLEYFTVDNMCFCCVLFLLSMFVRFLFVFDLLLILFRIVLWPSVGKDCPVSFSLF